jgi:hypothetical protein
MWTAVLSGVFALAGVMVGGALNLRVAQWQEQRREAREVRPVARLVMHELGEMQAVLFADAHRQPEYRMGGMGQPTAWPQGRATLAAVVDGATWTAVNRAYEMAEYLTLPEGHLPTRALYGRAWHPHEISQAFHEAQQHLRAYADLPRAWHLLEPVSDDDWYSEREGEGGDRVERDEHRRAPNEDIMGYMRKARRAAPVLGAVTAAGIGLLLRRTRPRRDRSR